MELLVGWVAVQQLAEELDNLLFRRVLNARHHHRNNLGNRSVVIGPLIPTLLVRLALLKVFVKPPVSLAESMAVFWFWESA
jgi:hypothetical protein